MHFFQLFCELYDNVVSDVEHTVVVYPGRFQPFHLGHASVYRHLYDKFPDADVYIATSDKVDPPRSPFSFAEKKMMMVAAGVPASAVRQITNPYAAVEITKDYPEDSTAVLFAISKKDMDENPRMNFAPKKDGSPGYLQPYTPSQVLPYAQHGYVLTIPVLDFDILGGSVRSASQIREMYATSDDAVRTEIITQLYGKFDPAIYKLFNAKLAS